ncbi:oncoprotein-induced transcript 3 protein isoform X2 [Exaiptasia diaphana]|uniref:EGF-like domain-containing protein n=1 Tax=Exaiptasia diaphana TaxID=2652724 RepID=A0A913WTL5_EXADI|nr:oncoprotein-induced transcript 3 protein isoform X2 [Exaiptasia diaphana]KXJ18042.1 Oncoprotein-induced transcript 3 protein [Exaiptasia diaphana]
MKAPTVGASRCDTQDLIKGWYRFEGEAGTSIATKCPDDMHCGTRATGWMKGNHPSQAEGIVTRKVCYNWASGNCCYATNDIRVRNCGGFYVYELVKPRNCLHGYCGNGEADDVDDCLKKPCQNGAQCIDGVNSYTCKCATGYIGPNCETNVDDCAKKPCQNGAECIDGVNS